MASRREFLVSAGIGLAVPSLAVVKASGASAEGCASSDPATASRGATAHVDCLRICLKEEYAEANGIGYYHGFCCPGGTLVNMTVSPPVTANCTGCNTPSGCNCIGGPSIGSIRSLRQDANTAPRSDEKSGAGASANRLPGEKQDFFLQAHLPKQTGGLSRYITWEDQFTRPNAAKNSPFKLEVAEFNPVAYDHAGARRKARLFQLTLRQKQGQVEELHSIFIGQELDPNDEVRVPCLDFAPIERVEQTHPEPACFHRVWVNSTRAHHVLLKSRA